MLGVILCPMTQNSTKKRGEKWSRLFLCEIAKASFSSSYFTAIYWNLHAKYSQINRLAVCMIRGIVCYTTDYGILSAHWKILWQLLVLNCGLGSLRSSGMSKGAELGWSTVSSGSKNATIKQKYCVSNSEK